MHALLVYPEYPETFWSFKYALKFIAKRAAYPPLGLLTVAALLPTDWEPRLVDLNVEPLRDADLQWADIVLISAMSIQTASARAVIARCRALGKPIIGGGQLFTALPEEFPEVDHLVLNEAEITLPLFLADWTRGQAGHSYTTTERADMRTSPAPRWDLIRSKHYASLSLQLSRGCPFDCEFCNITTLFGRIPRVKDTGQILAELERLYALGWRGPVFFVDDNFVGQKQAVKRDVLPAVTAWQRQHGHPFLFNAQVSLNLSDDAPLLAALVAAGFTTVFIGIESPNDASLAECNKSPNTGRNLLADIRIIQQAGLQVQGGFIVGFDNDPVSIFDRLTAFIQESGIVTAMVGLLNAPHGTRLYQRMAAEGRLLREMSGDNTDFSSNFTPRMPLDVLRQGYLRTIQEIYAPRTYYQRLKHFLRDFPHPVYRAKAHFRDIGTLLKTALVLGIMEKERVYYWRLLFWSLFTRPRLLGLAITLAAYGFHFRKSFEQHRPVDAG